MYSWRGYDALLLRAVDQERTAVSDTLDIVELDLDWDFLSHLALRDSWIEIRAEQISSDLLEDEYARKIFAWQSAHAREHGHPATASVLEAQFEDLTIEEPLTAIGDLVTRLRERYVRNNGKDALRSLASIYKSDPLETGPAMIKAGRELVALTATRGEVWGSGDTDRSILEYHKGVVKGMGPSFGFQELDDFFYGQRGLTFWLGAPKAGKSWLAINAVLRNIILGNYVELHALELPAYEAQMRVRCMAANIPWWKFVKCALDEDNLTKLRETGEWLDSLGLFKVLKPPYGERDGDDLVRGSIDRGADLVVIDQLQYLEVNGRALGDKNEPGAYWGVCNQLRDLSDEVPIHIVHQFNRGAAFMDEMPSMEYAKGSSAIEETATVCLGTWANKDMRASGITEIGTLAARNYALASWECKVELSHGCSFDIIGRCDD